MRSLEFRIENLEGSFSLIFFILIVNQSLFQIHYFTFQVRSALFQIRYSAPRSVREVGFPIPYSTLSYIPPDELH